MQEKPAVSNVVQIIYSCFSESFYATFQGLEGAPDAATTHGKPTEQHKAFETLKTTFSQLKKSWKQLKMGNRCCIFLSRIYHIFTNKTSSI